MKSDKKPSTCDRIMALCAEFPSSSAGEIAKLAGASRQTVYANCKKHGIILRDTRMRRNGAAKESTDQIPSIFTDGACELTVSANLLKSGIPVYRALSSVNSVNLVADVNGRLYRIEVRAIKRNGPIGLCLTAPGDRSKFDVLAMVDGVGNVTYRTNNFDSTAKEHEYINLRDLAASDRFLHKRNDRRVAEMEGRAPP